MTATTTGRRLDAQGEPIEGTGFTYDTHGPLAGLLASRTSSLISNPVTGEWVFGLVRGSAVDGAYERGVGVFPPGNAGPPPHWHPTYDEHFETVQGEFLFTLGDRQLRVTAGERVVVPAGTVHTFRNVGTDLGAAVVETRPAARIGEVLYTLFGMAHEGRLTSSGRPRLLHALAIARQFSDDTILTSPPPSIVLPLARVLAPVARLLRVTTTDQKYLDDSFWSQRVEQPAMSPAE